MNITSISLEALKTVGKTILDNKSFMKNKFHLELTEIIKNLP